MPPPSRRPASRGRTRRGRPRVDRARTVVGTSALVMALLGAVIVGAAGFVAWASSPPSTEPGYSMDVSARGHVSFTVQDDFAAQLSGAGVESVDAFTAVLAETDGVRTVEADWPTTVLLAGLVAGVLAGVAALLGLVLGERTPVLAVAAGTGVVSVALVVIAVVKVLGTSTVPQADLDVTLALGVGGYLALFGAALAALGGVGALLAATRADPT